jgi:hypothetical protein
MPVISAMWETQIGVQASQGKKTRPYSKNKAKQLDSTAQAEECLSGKRKALSSTHQWMEDKEHVVCMLNGAIKMNDVLFARKQMKLNSSCQAKQITQKDK